MKKTILLLGLLALCTSATAKPLYPPKEGEYYPRSNKELKVTPTNPRGENATVPYTGKNIDLFVHTDMVTQLQLPSPPVLVNIGKAEDFSVEVVPELNSLFIKPLAVTNLTNLIVTTDRGVYTFMLKDNPWRPFHQRLVVTNPYKQVKPTDEHTLLSIILNGKRPPSMQFYPFNLSTGYDAHTLKLKDTVASISLHKFLLLQRDNRAVYQVKVKNAGKTPFQIDEKSFAGDGLLSVALPAENKRLLPGDETDMLLISTARKTLTLQGDVITAEGGMRFKTTLSPAKFQPVKIPLNKTAEEKQKNAFFRNQKGKYTAESWAEEMRKRQQEQAQQEQAQPQVEQQQPQTYQPQAGYVKPQEEPKPKDSGEYVLNP